MTTKVFALLCGLSFLLYLDRVNLSTAASFIQRELNLSNLALGIAFSAFAYSYNIKSSSIFVSGAPVPAAASH